MKGFYTMIAGLLLMFAVRADEAQLYKMDIGIQFTCPMNEELQAYMDAVPAEDYASESFEDWKETFLKNIEQLILLVESGKLNDASWSVNSSSFDSK